MSFQDLISDMPAEITRLGEFAKTLLGWRNLITIHENHFKEKYIHGTNVVHDIARVNIILKSKGQSPLI